jgi:hypothetical protein
MKEKVAAPGRVEHRKRRLPAVNRQSAARAGRSGSVVSHVHLV